MAKANEIKYLTAIKAEKRPKKYCRFKKMGIHYIDYKDGDFLKRQYFLGRFSAFIAVRYFISFDFAMIMLLLFQLL